MLADTFGRPLRFRITPGQASDIASAPALPEGRCARAGRADKAYHANALRERIAAIDATAVIPTRRNRKIAIPHDAAICKHRSHSGDASAASSSSVASLPDMTDAPPTSPASSNSPPP